MTYNQIISELNEIELGSDFDKEMRLLCRDTLLEKLQVSDRIHSTGSLIRHLISYYEYDSEKWLYWQKVLFYFMTPDFMKDKNTLPCKEKT